MNIINALRFKKRRAQLAKGLPPYLTIANKRRSTGLVRAVLISLAIGVTTGYAIGYSHGNTLTEEQKQAIVIDKIASLDLVQVEFHPHIIPPMPKPRAEEVSKTYKERKN